MAKIQHINIGEIWKIKDDVEKIASTLSNELSKKAEKGMVKAFDSIIDNFYKYSPISYNRHNDLYNMLINHNTHMFNKYKYRASIKIGANDMSDHQRASAATIYDLMWIHGVRGLPKQGNNALSHDFTWYTPTGIKRWHEGEIWQNPFWGKQYENIFQTGINVDEYITNGKKIPQNIMKDFVENWGVIGRAECDKIVNKII